MTSLLLLWSLLTLEVLGHPLDARNFDCALQVDIHPTEILIDYELVVSELTLTTELLTLREFGEIPADGDEAVRLYCQTIAPRLQEGILLTVAASRKGLEFLQYEQTRSDHVYLTFRFRAVTPASYDRVVLEIEDQNFRDEPGYRRLAVRANNGAILATNDVPTALEAIPLKATWELTPEEEDARTHVAVTYTTVPSMRPATNDAAPRDRSEVNSTPLVKSNVETADNTSKARSGEERLRDLLGRNGQGVRFWIAVLFGAFGLGMVHALKPGHGKTLVAAYLVGEHGTIRHAVLLGLVMTLTHTGSVLFVALLLRPFAGAQWVEQGSLSFWLTLLSGALVTSLGVSLFWRRWHGQDDLLHKHGPGGHSHLPDGTIVWDSSGSHSHHHHHGHSHAPGPDAVSLGNLMTLGVSGGLVPCDDAVVLLLAAVGAGILGQAIYLLLAFSAGLAFVLVMVGIVVVKARGFATRRGHTGPWIQRLQVLSALGITIVGAVLCLSAFTG